METEYLNRVASRHADRFPEDFRFQLDREEYESLRCRIATSSGAQSGRGDRQCMLYAYMEQGIAMLSGLLNTRSPKTFLAGSTTFLRSARLLLRSYAIAGVVFQKVFPLERLGDVMVIAGELVRADLFVHPGSMAAAPYL
ncbi:ORF6N domain-containing protein [Adlercreutzia wanghongyangiae]|uniref:ORF6N domain-containing protein n=1 Tax=Adlercreutzia wanghongyangiae TaxID=3111451 RepID=UPI00374467A8